MHQFSPHRLWIGAALLACSLFCASVFALDTIRLTVTEYPPYTSEELPQGGVMVAIAQEAFRRGGYQMEASFRPWSRALHEAKTGQAEGIIALWHSKEREQWFLYSKPMASNQIGLVALTKAPLHFSALADLKPYTIGTVRNYANPPVFEAAKLTTIDSSNDEINLRALAAGRLDAVLIDKGVARYIIDKKLPEQSEKLVWVEPAIDRLPLYVVINKTVPDAEKKLAGFNAGLVAMERDGTLARMIKQAGI